MMTLDLYKYDIPLLEKVTSEGHGRVDIHILNHIGIATQIL